MSKLSNTLKAESHELSLLQVKGLKLVVLRKLHLTYFTRSELSEMLGIRISTLCGVLKRLENEGWIRVCFDTKDTETGRMVSVYTTTQAAEERVDCAAGIVERHWLGEPDVEPVAVALP